MKTVERAWISLGEIDGKEIIIPLTHEEPEISDIMDDYFRSVKRVRIAFLGAWLLCMLIPIAGVVYYYNF